MCFNYWTVRNSQIRGENNTSLKSRVEILCHHKPELENHLVSSGEVTHHRTELQSPASVFERPSTVNCVVSKQKKCMTQFPASTNLMMAHSGAQRNGRWRNAPRLTLMGSVQDVGQCSSNQNKLQFVLQNEECSTENWVCATESPVIAVTKNFILCWVILLCRAMQEKEQFSTVYTQIYRKPASWKLPPEQYWRVCIVWAL